MACHPIGPINVVSILFDSFDFEDGYYLQEVEVF